VALFPLRDHFHWPGPNLFGYPTVKRGADPRMGGRDFSSMAPVSSDLDEKRPSVNRNPPEDRRTMGAPLLQETAGDRDIPLSSGTCAEFSTAFFRLRRLPASPTQATISLDTGVIAYKTSGARCPPDEPEHGRII